MVRFKSGVNPPDAHRALARLGVRIEREVGGTGFSLVSTGDRSVEDVRRALEDSGVVEQAEPNALRRVAAVPNDPFFGQGQASYLQAAGLPGAWDVTTGSNDLVLAILDSGVDRDHPDLRDRLLQGWDFVNHDSRPDDDLGHGTMVAGVAGARTNNGIGVAGATWRGWILPVKVIDAFGQAEDADIIEGIRYAVDIGADVINLSLGGPDWSDALQEAMDYAVAHKVVVVAAAGNSGSSVPHFPAACNGVVAVGATDSTHTPVRLAEFSNFGSWIDLTAPGVNVTSTMNTAGPVERYGTSEGTSFSAPLVAATALLLRSLDPAASPATVVDRLRRSAVDRGASGFDAVYGSGTLDAAAALRLTPGFSASGVRPPSPGASTGYWMLGGGGTVYPFGDAPFFGEAAVGVEGAADLEPTPSGGGYWVVSRSGAVYAYGDAAYRGGLTDHPAGRLEAGETVTSLSATLTGSGYWIFTTAGRVFTFGDAPFFGDMRQQPLNAPVLDSIPTATGRGYYMVAADGGIFAFGDAVFIGSMGDQPLNSPVQSLVPDPDGSGYWLVAGDGGVFAFAAPFRGSMGSTPINAPITGMVPYGNAYLMVASDGGIFNFSDRAFAGSLGADPPLNPIVAVAALPS